LRTSSPATLTIYADQPMANSSQPVAGGEVGHAWISITQTVNHRTVTRVFGYYPEGKAAPFAPSDPGVLVDDGGHEYDVGVTTSITATELSQILNFVLNQFPGTYDLNTNNCTNFAIDVFRAAGLVVPENEADWLGGGGLCPGQLGEDLRNLDFPNR